MAWVPVKGGWLIECDRCGYSRGSYYKADGGKPHTREFAPKSRVPFRTQRLPPSWEVLQPGTPAEQIICPKCANRYM